MIMKVWFPVSTHQMKVGIVTDVFSDWIEVQEVESGQYYIKPFNKCIPIC
jgi:hypothetical protein